jgi:spermidine synthase
LKREWIEEIYKGGQSLRFGLKAKLFDGRSDYQRVEIYESSDHGRVLLNDRAFMLSERDERIYHEMMAHVPLCVHPKPQNVLIIGGGDGGTAREVLRHRSVEQVVLVEVDALVVEACRKFIPQTAAALSDKRLELRIEDGVDFVKKTDRKFDVILIDSTDPNGMATPLFGPEFYADVVKCLDVDGIVVAQGESVFYEDKTQSQLLAIAHPLFQYVSMFNFSNMTYPGGLWSFMWASLTKHPIKDMRLDLGLEMYYYNPGVHLASFQLPEFQVKALKPWTKI